MRKFFCLLFVLPLFTFAQKPSQPSSTEIKLKLEKLNFLGSVLYVAAHPDDENTRVITFLAKDQKVTTAYLSMTRGDGGQNLIGPEIGDKLGLIRTQELLSARRIDGGEQFFTRAVDFGFSKSADETLKVWDEEAVLSDVVKVFRMFKPDVILTRFPADARAGHGHHISSAILAAKAFDKGGEASFLPDQVKAFGVWTPKRLFTNTGRWWNTSINENTPGIVTLDVGGYSPLLGMSASERAAISRSQHKSQGFGSSGSRGKQLEFFEFVKGEKCDKDFFEGINTTWSRVRGGEKIKILVEKAIREYDVSHPSKSVTLLFQIRKEIGSLENSVWKERKLNEVNALIQDCLGLYCEVRADGYWVSPGENVVVSTEIVNRSPVAVTVKSIHSPDLNFDSTLNVSAGENTALEFKSVKRIRDDMKVSGPYWLQEDHTQGLFTVKDEKNIGKPEATPPVMVTFDLTVNGEDFSVVRPLVYKWNDPVKGELYRPFEIVPPVVMNVGTNVLVFGSEEPKEFSVVVKSNSKTLSNAKLYLEVPAGWSYSPKSYDLSFASLHQEIGKTFKITPSSGESTGSIIVITEIGGVRYSSGLEEISYDHIPSQILIRPSEAKAVKLAIRKEGSVVGYIKGAGDEIPAALRAIGYEVWEMNNEDVTDENLKKVDAVVFGIRALNTNERIPYFMNAVFNYAKVGGTVIMQYNNSNGLVMNDFTPYPIKLSRNRVTEEDATVRILAPNHPILNTPNAIQSSDFDHWIQERGLYFPSEWDPAFTPIFSMNDAGEDPLDGSLLVAKYGDGYFVYTGLSFFRELPYGVPGAYKLFANLVSLGKPRSDKMAGAKVKKK